MENINKVIKDPKGLEAQEELYEFFSTFNKTPYIKTEEPNRNDLCPCGSGKKYKKCCMEINRKIVNNLINE